MQSVKVSDSHPPAVLLMLETNRLTVRWLQVCVQFICSALPSLSSSSYLFTPARTLPRQTPHPSHRTPFFQRQTQARSLKLIHGVNVIFLPDFLCVSLSPPTLANQNADASRVWVALSPVHTGRGGWSPPSAVSPPRFLLFSTSTTPPCLPPLWIQALSVSFSLYAIRDAPDYLRYPLVSFLLL